MDFKRLTKDMTGLKKTANLQTWTILVLSCAVAFMGYKQMTMHERLVLVPPHMTKRAALTWDSAEADYKKQWVMYLTGQITSVTPGTADYLVRTLEPYFDKKIWNPVKNGLLLVKDDTAYKTSNPISQFVATGGIVHEVETDTYFITGRLISSAYRNNVIVPTGAMVVTYEYKMGVVNGLPKVTEFYSYKGPPRTLYWAKSNREQYDKMQEERKRSRDLETPADIVEPAPLVPAPDVQGFDNINEIPLAPDAIQTSQEAAQWQQSHPDAGLKPPVMNIKATADTMREAEQAAHKLEQQMESQQ